MEIAKANEAAHHLLSHLMLLCESVLLLLMEQSLLLLLLHHRCLSRPLSFRRLILSERLILSVNLRLLLRSTSPLHRILRSLGNHSSSTRRGGESGRRSTVDGEDGRLSAERSRWHSRRCVDESGRRPLIELVMLSSVMCERSRLTNDRLLRVRVNLLR